MKSKLCLLLPLLGSEDVALTMMHHYDAPGIDLKPEEVFWRVGNEGLVARCFHIHPNLVNPRVLNAPFTTTVDDDYLRAACPDPGDEYIIADSDLLCLCELSGLHRSLIGLTRIENDIDIARWAAMHTRPRHLEHFCRRIPLHSTGAKGAKWEAACGRSDAAVARILKHVVELRAGSA
jgi:hypothetical protein